MLALQGPALKSVEQIRAYFAGTILECSHLYPSKSHLLHVNALHFAGWTWGRACIYELISYAFIRILIDAALAQSSIFASLAWTVIRALGLGRPASDTSLARPSSFGVAARNL